MISFKHPFIVFCFFSFFSSSVFSQTNHLSFGFNGVSHQDTLHIGDTIHFNFWVVNQGVGAINDSLSISCETFDDLGSSIASMAIGSYYNTTGSLSAGDSLFIVISEVVSYQSYVLGDNIIVIWPASIGGGTVDTSVTDVYILDSVPSILNEELSCNNILLFPNPVYQDLLFLNSPCPVSSIRIFDIFGRLKYLDLDVSLDVATISLGKLAKGLYSVEIISNRERYVYKIIIQ